MDFEDKKLSTLVDIIYTNEKYIEKLQQDQSEDLLDDVKNWLEEMNLILDSFDDQLRNIKKTIALLTKLP